MFITKSPLDKEWNSFLKREERLLKKYEKQKEPFLDRKLKALVPETVSEKLEAAFYKAFQIILENGTDIIEKTYPKQKLEDEYKVREYRHKLQATRKNLKAGSKTAGMQTMVNVAGAGVEGAALGFLGIGLPDIPLFLGVIFRSLYTLSINYGIDYKKKEEQELLLELIAVSLNREGNFREQDAALNRQLYTLSQISKKVSENALERASTIEEPLVRKAAAALSGELLFMKFLQGVPIAGVLGGLYDGIYLKKISEYAAIKMERRYLLSKMEGCKVLN